jgi:hypothetical protein
MYVHIENEHVVELIDDDVVPPSEERSLDRAAYRLEFSENQLAQCKDAVGEVYVDAYDEIEPHTPSDEEPSEDESSEETELV